MDGGDSGWGGCLDCVGIEAINKTPCLLIIRQGVLWLLLVGLMRIASLLDNAAIDQRL